jgi:hypothetical protein
MADITRQLKNVMQYLGVLPITECEDILPTLGKFDDLLYWYRPDAHSDIIFPRIVTNLTMRSDGVCRGIIVRFPIEGCSFDEDAPHLYGDRSKFLPAPTAPFLRQLLPKRFEYEGANYRLSEEYLETGKYAVFYLRDNNEGMYFWHCGASPVSAYAAVIADLHALGIIGETE